MVMFNDWHGFNQENQKFLMECHQETLVTIVT